MFSAYVVQSKRHMLAAYENGQAQDKIFFWGSARFDPKWAKLNLSLMNKFRPNLNDNIKLKLVFFLPHWFYNVDEDKTMKLIKRTLKINRYFL